MWYYKVIAFLCVKIKEDEREKLLPFLKDFFEIIEGRLLFNDSLPIGASLSIVSKMYKRFAEKDDDSIAVKDFCQYLFNLVIVCCKNDAELVIWNCDFLPLLSKKSITELLEVQGKIDTYKQQLIDNEITYKSSSSYNDEKKAKILVMNAMERETLVEIGFNFNVDFDLLLSIFERNSSVELYMDFLKTTVNYSIETIEYYQFLHEIFQHFCELDTKSEELEYNDVEHRLISEFLAKISKNNLSVFSELELQIAFKIYLYDMSYRPVKALIKKDSELKFIFEKLHFSRLVEKFNAIEINKQDITEVYFQLQLNSLVNWLVKFDKENNKSTTMLRIVVIALIEASINYFKNKELFQYISFTCVNKGLIELARNNIELCPDLEKDLTRMHLAINALEYPYFDIFSELSFRNFFMQALPFYGENEQINELIKTIYDRSLLIFKPNKGILKRDNHFNILLDNLNLIQKKLVANFQDKMVSFFSGEQQVADKTKPETDSIMEVLTWKVLIAKQAYLISNLDTAVYQKFRLNFLDTIKKLIMDLQAKPDLKLIFGRLLFVTLGWDLNCLYKKKISFERYSDILINTLTSPTYEKKGEKLTTMEQQFIQLATKAIELENNGYLLLAEKLCVLITEMDIAKDIYVQNKSYENYQIFKYLCASSIKKVMPAFTEHPDLKIILQNMKYETYDEERIAVAVLDCSFFSFEKNTTSDFNYISAMSLV